MSHLGPGQHCAVNGPSRRTEKIKQVVALPKLHRNSAHITRNQTEHNEAAPPEEEMKIGTRSVLYGAHQFLWHPWTVAKAYRLVYGKWPTLDEWIGILTHDIGYWGSPNMDGEEGRKHPEVGANVAARIVFFFTRSVTRAVDVYFFTLYHSSHYAAMHNAEPSRLFLPDKVSILVESRRFYLLRATLSGEVREYIENSPFGKLPPELKTAGGWYNDYVQKVKNKLAAQ